MKKENEEIDDTFIASKKVPIELDDEENESDEDNQLNRDSCDSTSAAFKTIVSNLKKENEVLKNSISFLKEKNVHHESDLKKLTEDNLKLEEENNNLRYSIAEFYTLQEISRAISSILDINALLRYLNDIIIGVLGVTYSTIGIYDEEKKKIKIHTTNIVDKYEKIIVSDNINCNVVMDVLKNDKPIIENDVDEEKYVFTENRNIKALICIPLSTVTRKHGIVLVEHKAKFYNNEFTENNLRLLDIIGQQVSIAVENADLYNKMQEIARRDSLTGLYNRMYLNQRLEQEFDFAKKNNYVLSLVIFDIDFFKKFNDTYGHLFGDKILKAISSIVSAFMRKTDIMARFGGEEFVILLPGTGMKDAYEKAETLRKKVEEIKVPNGDEMVSVTVSAGVCSYPDFAENERDLLRKADDALYEAKSSGRNCVKIVKE